MNDVRRSSAACQNFDFPLNPRKISPKLGTLQKNRLTMYSKNKTHIEVNYTYVFISFSPQMSFWASLSWIKKMIHPGRLLNYSLYAIEMYKLGIWLLCFIKICLNSSSVKNSKWQVRMGSNVWLKLIKKDINRSVHPDKFLNKNPKTFFVLKIHQTCKIPLNLRENTLSWQHWGAATLCYIYGL